MSIVAPCVVFFLFPGADPSDALSAGDPYHFAADGSAGVGGKEHHHLGHRDNLPEHDVRYGMADEYTRLCYRLWEDSWADHAAENAECVFVSGANPQVAGDYARNVRAGTADDGRQADDVLVAPA